MDSTPEPEDADELYALTRQLRSQLVRYRGLNAWAAPGGPTQRPAQMPIGSNAEIVVPGESSAGSSAPSSAASSGWSADIAAGGALPIVDEPIVLGRRSLAQVREDLGECTRCKLSSTRKNIVFGSGPDDTPLMFIGEAPGEQEDKTGIPFVGRAG